MGILDRLLGRKQKLPEVKSDQSEEDQGLDREADENTIYALGLTDGMHKLVLMGMMSDSELLKTTTVLGPMVKEFMERKGIDLPDLPLGSVYDATIDRVRKSGRFGPVKLGKDAIYALLLINALRKLYLVGMSERDGLTGTMVMERLVEKWSK